MKAIETQYKGYRFREHGESGAPMKHTAGYLDDFEALRLSSTRSQ